jgi:two-component system phosphate regulon sensor histidine kinase PhoR
MLNFRQKLLLNYIAVFLLFIVVMLPVISHWVERLVIKTMEARAVEIITKIKDAPNNEALIRRLKNQKSAVFFRVSVISDEHKVLYDSHSKRLLGPKFSQDYIVDHPEVLEAFKAGQGYHEEFSKLLDQKFSYFAKAFDFNGHIYVLRTAFPYQYISQLINDFEIGFLGFSSAMLLLFSLMTWFIIHYLTKPIQLIVNAVKPYQEGIQTLLPAIDLGSVNPHGDFAKLALTLNSLSAKIQDHINVLTYERNEKKAILESLTEGVIAVDENFDISYINSTAKRLISSTEDLMSKNFSSANQMQCFDLLRSCTQKQAPLVDTMTVKLDGKKAYLEVTAAPKRDNGGAVLVLQDKTAHHKMTEMRRDFIANASHELKTPIMIIHGFAEALHDNPELPQDVHEEMTQKIMKNCQRMANVIKDLLTLADVENLPASRLSKCDLVQLTENCRYMVMEAFPEAQIRIERSGNQGCQVIADIHLLELAIMNLMENAAKYSEKPPRITVLLEDSRDFVRISVSDQGIGIPEADLEHIFDRFYTVNKAHSKKMGGSGLGLSIVQTIVEKHLGSISVRSTLGQGTTFTIVLPKRNIDLTVV